MDPRHRQLAEIALQAAGSEHGLGARWRLRRSRPRARRADLPAVADLVISALTDNGFVVDIAARAETFARLLVTRNDDPDSEPQKVELAADWRAHPPVTLSVGPVLHPDDAVGNKMAALYGRALARDFSRHRGRARQRTLFRRPSSPSVSASSSVTFRAERCPR